MWFRDYRECVDQALTLKMMRENLFKKCGYCRVNEDLIKASYKNARRGVKKNRKDEVLKVGVALQASCMQISICHYLIKSISQLI